MLISVPFPGAVYAAFRIAQTIKARFPEFTLALGGGFVNTELRELTEPRVLRLFRLPHPGRRRAPAARAA